MNNEALDKLKARGMPVKKSSRIPDYANHRSTSIKSHPPTGGSTALKEPTQYTGSAMVGIATMHKSNAVPVFSAESAEDISKMRR